jgi:signal transduction histidine kinase
MIEIIYVLVSVIFTLFMAVKSKKHLYVHQHESSIRKEIQTFENNLENTKEIDLLNNYKISLDHIY